LRETFAEPVTEPNARSAREYHVDHPERQHNREAQNLDALEIERVFLELVTEGFVIWIHAVAIRCSVIGTSVVIYIAVAAAKISPMSSNSNSNNSSTSNSNCHMSRVHTIAANVVVLVLYTLMVLVHIHDVMLSFWSCTGFHHHSSD
jgi:hypothetical protein